MDKKIVFDIKGEPQGKGRPRFTKKHTYTPDKTRDYESIVGLNYQNAARGYKFTSPVRVTIFARFGVPKSKSKKVATDMLKGHILPTKKPDIDNIAKIILDGLNHIAWDDDKQIVELIVGKRYGENPSVVVAIEEVIGRCC